MAEKATTYPVTMMCRTLHLNRASYYRWQARQTAPPSVRAQRHRQLTAVNPRALIEPGVKIPLCSREDRPDDQPQRLDQLRHQLDATAGETAEQHGGDDHQRPEYGVRDFLRRRSSYPPVTNRRRRVHTLTCGSLGGDVVQPTPLVHGPRVRPAMSRIEYHLRRPGGTYNFEMRAVLGPCGPRKQH